MLKKALSEFKQQTSESSYSSTNGKEDSSAVASETRKKNGKGIRVTAADTNKTRPIAIIEKVAKKKVDTLEPGDIILASSLEVPGVSATSMRAGSTALQGGFNHAAIYVGNDNIVEGRIGRGIKKLDLRKGTRGLSYTVVRPNLPRRVRKRAANVAKNQIGKEYSSGDLLRTGAALGVLPSALRNKVIGATDNSIDDADAMQCAALIAGSYQKANKKPILDLNYRYVAPVDLLAKTDSKIVKVKKAKKYGPQGTSVTFSSSASKAKEKYKDFVEKVASAGCLRMFCHVDATDWCPHGDVVSMLSKFFTKEVNVEIYPRHLVQEVWEKDHPCETYDKDYYAFRAYAGKDYCKIFVDETETKDSVLWVMLHELAHIALASSPFLFRGYRHLTPDNYFESDEAHESDPEEQMANSIAMSWMDMLGYGKVNYPRHWWRNRTMMNKKANATSRLRQLLAENADELRSAGIGAGVLGTGAAVKGSADAYRKSSEEDIEAMLAGKEITDEQRKKRRRKRAAGVAAKTIGGSVIGGVAGGGLHKLKNVLPDIAEDTMRRGGDELNKQTVDFKDRVENINLGRLLNPFKKKIENPVKEASSYEALRQYHSYLNGDYNG